VPAPGARAGINGIIGYDGLRAATAWQVAQLMAAAAAIKLHTAEDGSSVAQ